VKHLDRLSGEEIIELNIPTGIPLVYELDAALRLIRHFYLGDRAVVEAAQRAVAGEARVR
jgi:2,3-bisphosphoglycerate-dependent phosphoglycerate mutase